MDTSLASRTGGLERPLEQRVSYRLARLHVKLNAQATRILRRHGGLTLVQWRVLVMLNAFTETTAGQVARMTRFDKALISRTVKSLIRAGLVKARSDDSDQRQQLLSMTASGARVFDAAAPHMYARQDALLESMDATQREVMFDALDRLEEVADRTNAF
ncbi:MAG: MarR family winged helix-turn-helix transcriptional regulator [Boseongicola sp.]|nr:MarR family winged helix-turn-helix transcriptional regulator [Boseongicola sp.]MYH58948.1 winged helix-turn-helix transcriptional regulator [Boseongicola sp. SB0675_bin_26]